MLDQSTPCFYPVKRVGLDAWLGSISASATRFERVGVMRGPVPGGWLSKTRAARRTYQTHYMFYAPEAELAYDTPDVQATASPGSFVLFPPDVPYDIRLRSSRGHEPLLRFRFRLVVRETLLTPWDAVQVFTDATPVPAILDAVHAELAVPSVHMEARVRAHILLLFTDLLRRHAEESQPTRKLTRNQSLTLIRYARQRVHERPTPGDLAAHLRLSPTYFARIFKRTFSVSPRRWLVAERIRHAAQRLIESNQNVSEIAYELGYENIYLFSRQFREVMGMSAREYRRRH